MGFFRIEKPRITERSIYRLKIPENHAVKKIGDGTYEIEETDEERAINEE